MSQSNKAAKKLLELQYGKKCFLTGYYSKKLTYHHTAQKRANGGKATVENGSNILPLLHQWLHNNIEQEDKNLYWLINECIILYKMSIDLEKEDLQKEYEEEVMPIYQNIYLRLRKEK